MGGIIIFFAARIFLAIKIEHDIIHCLADRRILRDRAEPETTCRLMRQFFADAVQIFFGICELLRITVDKMHPTDQWLIGVVDLLLVQIIAA